MDDILLWTSQNPIYSSLIIFVIVTILLLLFVRKQLLKSEDTVVLLFSALGLFFIQLILPSNFREYEPYKEIIRLMISIIPIAISVILCLKYWKAMDEDLKAGKYGESLYPTLMVSQGTFFTFVGVSAILFSFNSKGNDINMLLAGLKLAFVTSVVGLVFSIAAKRYIKQKTDKYVSTNRTAIEKDYLDEKDFFNAIQKLNTDLINMSKTTDSIGKNMFIAATESVKANEERERVFEDFRRVMKDAMDENSKTMERNMAVLVEQFQNSIKETFKSMENGITKLDNAYAHLSKQSDTFVEKMDMVGNAEVKLVEKLTGLNSAIMEKLDQQSSDIIGRTSKLLNDTKELTEKTNSHYVANANMLNQCLNDTMVAFKESVDTAENECRNRIAAVSEFNKGAIDLLNGLNGSSTKMQESLERIALVMSNVDQCISKTNNSVEENKVMVAEYQERYSKVLGALVQQLVNIKFGIDHLNGAITNMKNGISGVNNEIIHSGESFSGSIKDITNKVSEIGNVVDKFKVLDSSLKQSNEVVGNLLNTLGSYNAVLKESQGGITQVSNNLTEGQALISKNSIALDKQIGMLDALIDKINKYQNEILEERKTLEVIRELSVKDYNDGVNKSQENFGHNNGDMNFIINE
jgi:biopolymer transport protein ExbB/TolQ